MSVFGRVISSFSILRPIQNIAFITQKLGASDEFDIRNHHRKMSRFNYKKGLFYMYINCNLSKYFCVHGRQFDM